MGRNIFNYGYKSETKDGKYAVTIESNLPTDKITIKNNYSSKFSEKSNKNDFSNTNEISISSNVNNLIKNNPFPFVKIKPKIGRYFK